MAKKLSKSRRFEVFVADLEQLFSERSVRVKSPDHIKDGQGVVREIDCTVRFKAGLADYLIMIECRDRTTPSDVQWVEQVKTKRESISADKAILVHSGHISTTALKKAKAFGIDVRRLSPRPQGDGPRITGQGIGQISTKMERHLSFRLACPEEIGRDVLAWLEANQLDSPYAGIIFDPRANVVCSVPEFVDRQARLMGIPSREGPEFERLPFTIVPSSECPYHLLAAGHEVPIASLEGHIIVIRPEVKLRLEGQSRYETDGDSQVHDVDQFTLEGVSDLISAAGRLVELEALSPVTRSFTYETAFHKPVNFNKLLDEASDEILRRHEHEFRN